MKSWKIKVTQRKQCTFTAGHISTLFAHNHVQINPGDISKCFISFVEAICNLIRSFWVFINTLFDMELLCLQIITKWAFVRRSHHSPHTTLLWALQVRFLASLNIQCLACDANDAVFKAFSGLAKRAFLSVAPLDICYALRSSLCWVSNPRPWIAYIQVLPSIPCMHHNYVINLQMYKYKNLAKIQHNAL